MSNRSETRSSSDRGQLAQPLVVEEGEGADPDAGLVQLGRLGHDRVVVLGGPVEHEGGGPGGPHRVDHRATVPLPPAASCGESTQASTAGRSGWASSSSPQVDALVEAGHRHHPIPLAVPGGPVPGQGGQEDEVGDQQAGGADDDETGQRGGRPGGAGGRRCRGRRRSSSRRPASERPTGGCGAGRAGRRRRRPTTEEADVGQRPGETEGIGVVVAVGGGVGLAQPEDDADRPQRPAGDGRGDAWGTYRPVAGAS